MRRDRVRALLDVGVRNDRPFPDGKLTRWWDVDSVTILSASQAGPSRPAATRRYADDGLRADDAASPFSSRHRKRTK